MTFAKSIVLSYSMVSQHVALVINEEKQLLERPQKKFSLLIHGLIEF